MCHWARFEGQMLDLSFVNKNIICLTSTPSDELNINNESEQVRFSGEKIFIFHVDKTEKSIELQQIQFIKGRCSGLCLNDNGKFFYTILQKRKILGKFKLADKANKAQPIQKCETGHGLDVHRIMKVYLVLLNIFHWTFFSFYGQMRGRGVAHCSKTTTLHNSYY